MAHVVGVPKRDPCQKCGLPVFLAERLTVGKRVYHRTCLKCARCSFQLTPGSFYETEVDGEYCCETCPDEETSLESETHVALRNPSSVDSDMPEAARPKSRIADRLAFFEKAKVEESASSSISSSSKVLQKSLSDEEKSKSLKKINNETSLPYKMNAALSSFMSSTLDDEIDTGEPDNSPNSGQMDASESNDITSDSEDDEVSEEKPPKLPTSLPPDDSTLTRQSTQEPENQVKTLKSEMKIQLLQKQPEEPLIPTKEITPKPIDATSKELEELASNTITSIQITKPADDLNLSKSNFVTKDNTETDEQMRTTNATNVVNTPLLLSSSLPPSSSTTESAAENPIQQEKESDDDKSTILRKRPITLDIKTSCNSDMTTTYEDEETTNRLSVVRARLHQFEVIANNKSTNDNLMNKTPEHSPNNNINSSSLKSDSSIKSIVLEKQKDDKDKMEMDEETSSITKETASSIVAENLNNEETKSESEVPKDVEEIEEKQKDNKIAKDSEESKMQEATEIDNDANTPSAQNKNAFETSPEDNQVLKKEIIQQEENEHDKTKQTNETKETAMKDTHSKKTPEIKDKPTTSFTSPAKVDLALYPEELNPFASDDDEDEGEIAPLPNVSPVKPVTPLPRKSLHNQQSPATSAKKDDKDRSLNPFDSSDDEVEMEKKVKPPRPPPPKISKNPFGSESDEVGDENCSKSGNMDKPQPVPKPRTSLSQSQNQTPEPTPRLGNRHSTSHPQHVTPLTNTDDFYGSNSSLGSTPHSLQRNSGVRGSNVSLTSSTGTIRSRKQHRAPAPPPVSVKELFPSTETLDSKKSSPSSSNSATPNQRRKKRPAPAPPKPARLLDPATVLAAKVDQMTGSKNSLSYPLQSDLEKLSDEEKALLEGNCLANEPNEKEDIQHEQPDDEYIGGKKNVQKLIPLDASLLSDPNDSVITKREEENVIYRRTIVPKDILSTPTREDCPMFVSHDRQLEKMKDNKEAQNRNRQSQVSSGAEDTDPLYNKSSHGKWKRRKGPAPGLPIPQRRVLQMLPLQEIRHELDIIEVQQQGLEKQGVILEKMIRDRCEGQNGELNAGAEVTTTTTATDASTGHPQNSKEVEDLILQLFELVNEKNELFRRQAELMYLRRQHRLEQEQADLEYEIRVLMAQPERNKTDSDKAREEALIARMVEVVQLRNEVVECLEMDRLREAEEDLSIKQRLELHSAKREEETNRNTLSKLSKKEKKKQKESKKLGKSKKLDADKDADETELATEKQKLKKKKKKFLF